MPRLLRVDYKDKKGLQIGVSGTSSAPYFRATDVCDVIGFSDYRRVLFFKVDDRDKIVFPDNDVYITKRGLADLLCDEEDLKVLLLK